MCFAVFAVQQQVAVCRRPQDLYSSFNLVAEDFGPSVYNLSIPYTTLGLTIDSAVCQPKRFFVIASTSYMVRAGGRLLLLARADVYLVSTVCPPNS